ncbi:MAG: phosphodiester glycosidase family protein [Clostridia bacterium]|nr:phosphodiester glycosidase family protein [Clostridia bacterium]
MKRSILIIMFLFALFFCACGGLNSAVTSTPAPTVSPEIIAEDELVFITPVPTDTPEPPTPTPEPTPTPTPSPSPTPTPTPEPEGLIGWVEGGFVPREEQFMTETEYAGENLHFTVSTITDDELFHHKLTYYVTDIYLRDIRCLRTAAAKDFKPSSSSRDSVARIAKREGALLAISGDMFNAHTNRFVIRNGEVFNTKTHDNWEICFLYTDGTFEPMTVEAYKKNGPSKEVWQAWEFGPSLLDADGHALNKFPNSNVKPLNPRCAIGYYEPGHYCFVTVDGRQKHSKGLELFELAKLMEMLSCKAAFNLDGGGSASLYWNGGIYSKPSNGDRDMSDIVYLIDYEADDGTP